MAIVAASVPVVTDGPAGPGSASSDPRVGGTVTVSGAVAVGPATAVPLPAVLCAAWYS